MSAPVLAITVTPIRQGYNGHPVPVTVSNSGTVPITVNTTVLRLHSGCGVKGVTVTPASFTEKPGQISHAAVSIAPGTLPGDYGVVFSAQLSGKGAVKVNGGAGSQVVVPGTVSATCSASHQQAAPTVHSAGFPIGYVALIAVLFVLAVAGVILYRRTA